VVSSLAAAAPVGSLVGQVAVMVWTADAVAYQQSSDLWCSLEPLTSVAEAPVGSGLVGQAEAWVREAVAYQQSSDLWCSFEPLTSVAEAPVGSGSVGQAEAWTREAVRYQHPSALW